MQAGVSLLDACESKAGRAHARGTAGGNRVSLAGIYRRQSLLARRGKGNPDLFNVAILLKQKLSDERKIAKCALSLAKVLRT